MCENKKNNKDIKAGHKPTIPKLCQNNINATTAQSLIQNKGMLLSYKSKKILKPKWHKSVTQGMNCVHNNSKREKILKPQKGKNNNSHTKAKQNKNANKTAKKCAKSQVLTCLFKVAQKKQHAPLSRHKNKQ